MSTTLVIRNLDESVKHRLRVQAATNGRAMEAEAREILTKAVMGTSGSSAPPPPISKRRSKSACDSVRGIWKGRFTTDDVMNLTRGR